MPTALDDLEAFAHLQLRRFLTDLGPDWIVIGDAEVVADLRAEPVPCGTLAAATLDEIARAPELLGAHPRRLVWTATGEPEVLAAVERLAPDGATFGFFRDLLPTRAAGRPLDADRTPATHGFVMLNLPRSGSYHLCSLLENAGFGAPTEHLRWAMHPAETQGRFDPIAFLDALRGLAVAGSWFGTKIIGDRLLAALPDDPGRDRFRAWLAEHGLKTIYLRRRDKVRQAVSYVIAMRTGEWVRRERATAEPPAEAPAADGPPTPDGAESPAAAESPEAAGFPATADGATSTAAPTTAAVPATTEAPEPPPTPYDFDALHAAWQMFCQLEERLAALIAGLPDVVVVDYEDLDTDASTAMLPVLEHLTGERPAPGSVETRSTTARQRDEHSEMLARRFVADLAARGA